ncbi:ATP-dependent helicase [Skermanella aerolata]|uniref:ATP-dependent helicase n=1 Tax=Skermanella aerolata TaxID=393310 RepID=A0A512DV60_9PROT|nr:DEAD/DEAH box helicase [Skermanella aerolata]KJB94826.1 helicase HelZ [Skermanella aerolata KACC 11604]GEO40361.1 ATP-dependent helicase [Skermanella aerolata]
MSVFFHAAFDAGRLWLWGETARDSAVPLPPPRGRKPRQPRALSSPFDIGAEALDEIAGLMDLAADVNRATLWLPSTAERPVASSPLVEEPPEQPGDVTLRAWETTVLGLETDDIVKLLTECPPDRTFAPGLFAAADLVYWTMALRFAGAIVARGAVLPDLVMNADDSAFARWRPAFLGRDAQALARLAHAMPDAARSVGTIAAAPDTGPAAVLAEFVALMADGLIRREPEALPKPSRATLDDRWLAALTGGDAALKADGYEIREFAQRIGQWRRPVAVTAGSPVRLCFRLEEPLVLTDSGDGKDSGQEDDEDGENARAVVNPTGPWMVRFLLQPHDDPSLLVPAADLCDGGGSELARLTGGKADLKEFLLLSFAQASRLCPPVEASLKRGIPEGFETDATGAVDFLTKYAAGLEQAGFGVLLPSWWTAKGTKTRISARAKVRASKMQGGSGLSLDELVKFDWEVALGDQTLSGQDLMALARLKTPLVRVRGQWVLLDAAEIKEAAARLKRRGEQATVRDLVRMALGGGGDSDIEGIAAEGWIDELLGRLTGREPIDDLPPPKGLEAILRPYQGRGYSWLSFLRRWELGACLADDMGLGKTIQTLALIQHDRETASSKPTVLLVCPTSVVGNWQREAARFTPRLKVMIHHGAARTKTATELSRECRRHDLVVTSYSLLQRDAEALKSVPWTGVVLDEAQNIKNPETRQAKAARAMKSGYRVALTGTPVENNVGDLWSLMEFLNPGFLGTQTAFKRNFFVPIQTRRDGDAINRLKSLTGPFVLRRLKTDKSIIDDLPEKLEMKVFCTLTKEQASLYAAVVEEQLNALEQADGIQRRGMVLATLAKLKQICNHPAQFLGDNTAIDGRSGKLARLTEMLEEVLAVGEKALVFTQFTEMGDMIQRHLQENFGREVIFLHGGVPKAKRDRMVERFQNDGADGADGPPIFLLSLKAGGTGLTLTAANHVFHYDRWWNTAVENQATDRAFRIGQTKQVQVHKFICAGTLEDKIDEMIEAKKSVAEAIVGAGEDWLTELNTSQLRDLLSLSREAVG